MSEIIELLTPVGRLVQGSPFTPNTKDATGAPLIYKTGANAGQPRSDYYMAIAIPKTDPGIPELMGKIQRAAQAGFPGGQFNAPDFAWKFMDGDGVDAQGKPYADREGFAGCYVFKFSGGYPPKCYSAGGAALLTDPESIKRGYYIRIYGSTTGNGSAQQPGIYLNHSMVELIGYGEEIVSGPDGATVFGGTPAGALPPGASATPVAPATPLAPGNAPGAVTPAAAPPGQVAGVPPVAASPSNPPVAPHPAILTPATYLVQGAQYTAEQLKGFGWTDAQIAAAQRVA